ncbi:hypothetical protein GCM10022271_26340 [Corallibacter vietnamensis]|uniref:DUF4382 domain-containing protein n=1 Tax=Corallibacter vietnamensis TaxID=904130 RepID=A0ABP7HKK2_9FLAO
MKVLKFLYLIVIVAFVVSCSSDDDTVIPFVTAPQNNVTVGESVFEMKSAIISSSIGNNTYIQLTNKTETELLANMNDGTNLYDVDFMVIRLNQDPLGETTYTFSDMLDYDFMIDGDIIYGEYEDGITLLAENHSDTNLEAVSGSVTITYYAVDRIDLTFEFERNDGTIITGSYSGSFIDEVDSDN